MEYGEAGSSLPKRAGVVSDQGSRDWEVKGLLYGRVVWS